MRTMNQILENLNDEQKQLLADTINHGSWGDCEVEFNNAKIDYATGYITNDAYKGGHFERKSLSTRFQSLFKALGLEGTKNSKRNNEMRWIYDWWGDGSGSVLFIRDGLDAEFEQWAREYNK